MAVNTERERDQHTMSAMQYVDNWALTANTNMVDKKINQQKDNLEKKSINVSVNKSKNNDWKTKQQHVESLLDGQLATCSLR